MAVEAEQVAESPWVERMARFGLIAQGVSFANEAMARDYMTSHIANNPNDAGEVHVIPAFEEAA